MGKKNKASSSSNKKAPKCTCDHPYQCSCGNRLERPSRGHKWDPETQQWGGKGHKQKGGSGTAAAVGTAAKVTTKGSTSIEQWQKLPSTLLQDVVKKEKRPPPKYKSLKNQGKFLYRVIIQDAKASKRGGEHDIILVPAHSAKNEEQAKEEAALLGLLHLAPSIPHERKLPEPYKTTWLNALEAKKNQKKDSKKAVEKDPSTKTSSASGDAAKATSSNLVSAKNFSSLREKRKQTEEKQKARNAKIRRHEAIRMANRDVQVFMSAQIRKQIEILLRGDADLDLLKALTEEKGMDEEDLDNEEEEDVTYVYVLKRLVHEGFTKKLAKAGFTAVKKDPSAALKSMSDLEDEYMDKCYEESLQWLCVHLDEDQLPEGFDPRGRTLDVVKPKTFKTNKLSANQGQQDSGENSQVSKEVQSIVQKLGVSLEEASCLKSSGKNVQQEFWNALCQLNAIDSSEFCFGKDLESGDFEQNRSIVEEETEVLRAMFPEEEDMQISKNVDSEQRSIVDIKIPFQAMDEKKYTIFIQYYDGHYPAKHPMVFIHGEWDNFTPGKGTFVHSEIIKQMKEIPVHEPMAFEIFNCIQEILQNDVETSVKNGSESLLLPFVEGGDKFQIKTNSKVENVTVQSKRPKRISPRLSFKPRKRVKSFFWSKKPHETPVATAFPKLRSDIKVARERLPAAKARTQFLQIMLDAEKKDRVVLITGETGCGKTTQIPQFILEESPKDAKIIVAQPRRLAATGVADRVAQERGEARPGEGSVGYVVRGDSKVSNDCRLMFCTTGVLLRQLQTEGALDCISHIVIDEVHERHLDTDILLAILKETRPAHLNVVLMSATMDADRFAAYWGTSTPRMHIPGFTHPVKDLFLDDVLSLTGYIPPKKGKKKKFGNWSNHSTRKKTAWNDSELSDNDDDYYELDPASDTASMKVSTAKTMTIPIEELVKRVNSNEVDYDMVAQLVKHLVFQKEKGNDGSILVFLPGAPEIKRAKETILKVTKGDSMLILPLHGGLQPQDQKKVFDSPGYGITKVILSTNVAETSITIPDVTLVIDCCREKQSAYDPSNRMPLLIEKFASQDSLKQRRGRSGRVRPGTCYKLISRETFNGLPEHGEPEIKRCALDQTLLSLIFLGLERGSGTFLSKLIDPPSSTSIESAIFSLEKLGALFKSKIEEEIRVSLTPLGVHLAGIPAPPSIGKLLVYGSLLGCRSAALAIAAGLSGGKSPFLRIDRRSIDTDTKEGYKNQMVLDERDKLFDSVGNSDHAMLSAIYNGWDSLSGGGGVKRKFLESLGLSVNAMRDIKQLVSQLDGALASGGFYATSESDCNGKSWRIIRSCVVASFAPAQIARVQRSSTKYAETVEGAVEKEGEAKELKFYTRSSGDKDSSVDSSNLTKHYHGTSEGRCFVHPSSFTFSVGSYTCPWIVYYQLVRTSKPFMRDVTECSNYDLLLFGGNIEVSASDGIIVVDDYVRMSANARIAALISGLRKRVDNLLTKKIAEPSFDVAKSVEMKLIVKLLRTDGMDWERKSKTEVQRNVQNKFQ